MNVIMHHLIILISLKHNVYIFSRCDKQKLMEVVYDTNQQENTSGFLDTLKNVPVPC